MAVGLIAVTRRVLVFGMPDELVLAVVANWTRFAPVGLVSDVSALVIVLVTDGCERSWAVHALVGFFTRVDPHMN